MPPAEVLERFTEGELVHLLAYERLYGQLGPERLDTLFGRLGMDVAAPHMKKGKKPKFTDHVVKWGGAKGPKRKKQTPEEMLQAANRIQRNLTRKRAKRNTTE